MLLQEYQKKWVTDFQEIRAVLNYILADLPSNLNVEIEHIGSSSVPNLAGKPIIDIDVIIDNYRLFDDVKLRLESIGYYHNGNQGIINREVFKRSKTFNHNILDSITHHLYVCPKDSEELHKHILFRDFLIANEDARIEYQNLKYDIAEESNQDKKRYAELKESKAKDFINDIIIQAGKEQKI